MNKKLKKVLKKAKSEGEFMAGKNTRFEYAFGPTHQTVYNAKKYEGYPLSEVMVINDGEHDYLVRVDLKVFGRRQPRGLK